MKVCDVRITAGDLTGTVDATRRPAEPVTSRLKDRVRISAYVVEELGGLIWAYLGPRPHRSFQDLISMSGMTWTAILASLCSHATGFRWLRTRWTLSTWSTFMPAT